MRSRLIAWLRVLLPLAALAILSTLFLLGRTPDPDDALPYAEVDAEDMVRDPRMTRPEFAGVSKSGAEVTVTADRASPLQGSDSAAEAQRYAELAREFGLAASRGSDFHSPDESHIDLGKLPPLPDGLTPVWQLLAGRVH